MTNAYLSVKNLNVYNPNRPQEKLLDNVSFSVHPGETFGVLGESGAGKSLITRVLTGRFNAYQGEVDIIDGIHLVPQDPVGGLHPRHTVEFILQEPLYLRGEMDCAQERIEQALSETYLDQSFLRRYPHELSGGQRQRVCIARALICKPKVVFLDEPTSALDAYIKGRVLKLLRDLKKTHNLTYFFVAHSLVAMEYLADRIAIMRQGEILEIVTKKQLNENQLQDPYSQKLITAYRSLAK
ncbi:MAG: ATP-binding cassette domain-containing protein [Alphaproteobacteria bacterium]|nr:ATP-binding cassette domain-containing protein [Alphaproteobacteria bacterium]